MSPAEPKVLFEDVHLIVIEKPAGLLTQGDRTGDDSVVEWARRRFGRPFVGLVHRLDRGTSGLLVVAKRTKSANRLTEALQSGKLERSYLAWVEGKIDEPKTWRHSLLKDEATNTVRVVPPGTVGSKRAELILEPQRHGSFGHQTVTLVRFTLQTGRSHQIRAQAKAEKHPLVGDLKYGSRVHARRVALHSAELRFPHPMSGETLSFKSELPHDFPCGDLGR